MSRQNTRDISQSSQVSNGSATETALGEENTRLKDLLEQERLRCSKLEKELQTTRTMFREATEASARIKRMLSWRLGHAFVQVNSVWDAIRLPWTIREILVDFRRNRSNNPASKAPATGRDDSPAAAAHAIKRTLKHARTHGYSQMNTWISEQKWSNAITAQVLVELALRACKQSPAHAQAFAIRAKQLAPSPSMECRLGFAFHDAGMHDEAVQLLQDAHRNSLTLSQAEQQKISRILKKASSRKTISPRLIGKGVAKGNKNPKNFLLIVNDSVLQHHTAETISLHEGLRALDRQGIKAAVASLAPLPADKTAALPDATLIEQIIDGVAYFAVAEAADHDSDDHAQAEKLASLLATLAVDHEASAIFAEAAPRVAALAAGVAQLADIPFLLFIDALDSQSATESLREIADVSAAIITASAPLRNSLLALNFQPKLLLQGGLQRAAIGAITPSPEQIRSGVAPLRLGYTASAMPKIVAHYLVDLLRALLASGQPAHLNVLSTAGIAALRQYATEHDVLRHITILPPFPTQEARQEALHSLDLVVFPSPSGARPASALPSAQPVLEAMGHGRCVFGANIPAYAELLKDGDTGFLFDPMAPISDHVQGIKNLLESPEQQAAVALRAYKRAHAYADFGLSSDTIRNALAHVNHPGAALAQNPVIH